MFLDIKYYINELNTNTNYITFENYIISKYGIFIYTDILNEIIKYWKLGLRYRGNCKK